jgi:hypothetical protein
VPTTVLLRRETLLAGLRGFVLAYLLHGFVALAGMSGGFLELFLGG